MASFPNYFTNIGKAVEKLARDYLGTSAARDNPGAPVVNPSSPAAPDAAAVDTVHAVVPDPVSSANHEPDAVETQEEVGLQDYSIDNGSKEENIRTVSAKPRNNVHRGDCSNYLRTGTCQVNEESEKGDLSEKKGQEECKYPLQPGGCKFGKACRFSHSQGKPTLLPSLPTQPLDFNFLDLPIRPGERECSYYMRNGFCKYGRNCWFHHPDPVAVEEGHIPPASFLFSPSGVLEPTSASLSSPSNGDVPYLEAANLYVPSMVLPHQWVPDPEWNEYQAPSSHEWTQPLLVPNPVHAGWSRPKTPPAMDGNCRKDAKKTKNLQSPYCHICKIHCTSKHDLVQHKLGKKHKEKEALKKSKKETSAPAASVAPVVKDPVIGPRQSADISEGKTVRQSAECEIRNIDCRSKDVLDQHKMEKKHQNNLEKVEQSKKEAEVVQSLCCDICKVHCTSEDILGQHKLGKKHKKKMDALEKSKKETSASAASAAPMVKHPMIVPKEGPEIDDGMTVTKPAECEIPNIDTRNKNVLDQHKLEKKHQIKLEKVEQSKKEAEVVESLCCDICKVHCTSEDILGQHKLGKKHKKKMDALEKSKKETSASAASAAPMVKDPMIGPKKSPPEIEEGMTVTNAECEVPNIDARSKNVLDQHELEKKHQNNLEKVEQSKKEAEVVQSLCCEICKVHCTSEDILAQHKLGKKHKKKMDALEKSKKETSASAASAAPMVKDPMIGPKERPKIDEGMTVTKSVECEVPNVDTSKNVLDQHELEKKHQNNLEKVEQTKNEANAPAAKDPLIDPNPERNLYQATFQYKGKQLLLVANPKHPVNGTCSNNVSKEHKLEKKHRDLEKLEESKKKTLSSATTEAPAAGPFELQATFQYKGKQLLLVANPKHPVNGTCSNNVSKEHKLEKKHRNLEKLEESKKKTLSSATTEAPAANDRMVSPEETQQIMMAKLPE